jgi:hypothetical protein
MHVFSQIAHLCNLHTIDRLRKAIRWQMQRMHQGRLSCKTGDHNPQLLYLKAANAPSVDLEIARQHGIVAAIV